MKSPALVNYEYSFYTTLNQGNLLAKDKWRICKRAARFTYGLDALLKDLPWFTTQVNGFSSGQTMFCKVWGLWVDGYLAWLWTGFELKKLNILSFHLDLALPSLKLLNPTCSKLQIFCHLNKVVNRWRNILNKHSLLNQHSKWLSVKRHTFKSNTWGLNKIQILHLAYSFVHVSSH